MKTPRPHRFPPLSQILSAPQRGSDPMYQHGSSVEKFQEGYDSGYKEGYESGLELGRGDGMADGRRDGLVEGRREALANFETLADPVDAMVEALTHLQADYRSALRKEVVDLVAKVARQVIRCELALQPVQLLALVDETLATMPPAAEGTEVYLNPEDLQRIRELAPERAARWTLIADSFLEAGECRVKSGGHEADAGCRQRLAACIEQVDAQLADQVVGQMVIDAEVP